MYKKTISHLTFEELTIKFKRNKTNYYVQLNFNKKDLLMKKFCAFLLTSILLSSSAFANKNIEWNLAMDWKTTDTPMASTSFRVAQLVKEMTNERFIIKINGREKHNSKVSILKLIQDERYQIGHTNSSQYKDLDLNMIWFTSTPLGMTTKEQNAWLYQGNGQKYMTKVFSKFGILSFPGGDLGTLNGGWSNKNIQNIQDFKNLTLNTYGIESELLMMHGATIKQIPLSQIQDKFEKGELDLIHGISPSIDRKMGYHKIASYFYTGWDRPASQMQFIVNQNSFEKLSKNYQNILKIAMKIASFELYYENYYANSEALRKILLEYPNIKIKSFSQEIISELKKTKKLIFTQYSKENLLFKEIYDDQTKFLENIRKWSKLEENSYLNSVGQIE